MTWPLMYVPARLQRYSTALATSASSPARPVHHQHLNQHIKPRERASTPAGILSRTLSSSLSFLPLSLPAALISLSTNAGAMQLTLTPTPQKAYAHSLVRCSNPAIAAECANRPCECVLVSPARSATFSTMLECPGAAFAPLSSSGRSTAMRKWWVVTLPAQATRHASAPSRVIQSLMAAESEKSIPASRDAPPAGREDAGRREARARARGSGSTLAELIRMLISLSSWVFRTVATPVIPSDVVVSPGNLSSLV